MKLLRTIWCRLTGRCAVPLNHDAALTRMETETARMRAWVDAYEERVKLERQWREYGERHRP